MMHVINNYMKREVNKRKRVIIKENKKSKTLFDLSKYML